MATISFDLVSPENLIFNDEVGMIIVPGKDGDFGVLPGHSKVMSSLRPGRVMVYGEDKNLLKAFFVSGGFAEVNPEKCIVLAESVDEINTIEKQSIEKEIEAIIFAAAEPLEIETIEDRISKKIDVKKILKKLEDVYKNRGINLVCISNKWSFRTASNLSSLMSKQKTVEKKLSKAAIETLSIIVYHQPVTRAEIEEIRGVAFGTNTLDILMELNWVKPMGRKEIPGKPIQYGTTEDFLSHFNLQKLSDLPTVDELGSAGLIDSSTIDSSIFGTGKFYKEKQDEKKENIYSNIDEMLNSTLNDDAKE